MRVENFGIFRGRWERSGRGEVPQEWPCGVRLSAFDSKSRKLTGIGSCGRRNVNIPRRQSSLAVSLLTRCSQHCMLGSL